MTGRNLGVLIGPVLAGFVVEWSGGWTPVMPLMGGIGLAHERISAVSMSGPGASGALLLKAELEIALGRLDAAEETVRMMPGDVDIAPETLIWGGPDPAPSEQRRPAKSLRPQAPRV